MRCYGSVILHRQNHLLEPVVISIAKELDKKTTEEVEKTEIFWKYKKDLSELIEPIWNLELQKYSL